jgi:hypothetical protein
MAKARCLAQEFAIERTDLVFWPFDTGTSASHPYTRIRVKPDRATESWVLTEA